MGRYVIKRLLVAIPTIIGLGIFVFLVMRVLPGDVTYSILGEDADPRDIAALREKMGLNAPLYLQFKDWMWQVARFSVDSLVSEYPLTFWLKSALPLTASMALLSILITVVVGIPLGVISAVRQNTWVDYVLRVITIAGLSMPTFWTGVLAIFFLVILFNWIPPFEYANPFKNPFGSLQQLILPALVLSYSQLAEVARITRSSMLEVLREDYIRTAQAKGLRQIVVMRRHALRNALIPVLTMAGVQFAFMLNGSIVVETIFNLKGVGFLMIEAVQNRDYPVIEMLIMLIGVLVVSVNLVIDVLYGYIDPRIRTGGSAL